MPVYEPPTHDVVPPIYMERDRFYPVPALSQRLFRHYKSRARGRQAYILNDNTVTEVQPWNNENVRTIVYGGHLNDLSELDYELARAYFEGGLPVGGTWGDLALVPWGALEVDTWLALGS